MRRGCAGTIQSMSARNYDVIVVGGGMAGSIAALSAAEEGLRVLIVEAEPTGLGGSAGMAVGVISVVEDIELFHARNCGRVALLSHIVGHYDRDISWLASQGIVLGPLVHGIFGKLRGHKVVFGMPAMFDLLASRLEKLGAERRQGARATRARMISGSAIELYTSPLSKEGEIGVFTARSLVLATGGYQANRTMLRREHPWANRFVLRASGHNLGDGIKLGRQLGGEMALDSHGGFYGHLLPDLNRPIGADEFIRLTQYQSKNGVLLNLDGKRFTEEVQGDDANARALSTQVEATGWLIMGEVEESMIGIDAMDAFSVAVAEGATHTVANSVPEVVKYLGEHGTPREYLAGKSVLLESLGARQPPIRVIKVVVGITQTYDGLAVDDNSRVLARSGEPIPGLFAAGGDVGGLHRNEWAGGLGAALVEGRSAGLAAARHAGDAAHSMM